MKCPACNHEFDTPQTVAEKHYPKSLEEIHQLRLMNIDLRKKLEAVQQELEAERSMSIFKLILRRIKRFFKH